MPSKDMKECTAKIIAVSDLTRAGAVTDMVNVMFEVRNLPRDQYVGPTPVAFKDPPLVWGMSEETYRLNERRYPEEHPGYQIQKGTFSASLPRHAGLEVGKTFIVLVEEA